MFRTGAIALFIGIVTSAPPSPDVSGNWEGALDVGVKLRLAFKITKNDDGSYKTVMDSLDQGAKDIPIKVTKVEDNHLVFVAPNMKAEFRGKLSDDGKIATGEWKQGDKTLPLELRRVDQITVVRRPQEPKKPYPYHEEEVTFDNKDAKITLAGTLTKPKSGGPFKTVVLVSGSGPQDRDESILGHKPFLVLADHLTRQGLAVLRYDDRGVGKSTGKHNAATTADFATDAAAAVQYLKTRADVDAKKIGIAGHSEGGLIGPIVAAEHPGDVGFLVLMAGPGLRGDEVIVDQLGGIARASGEKESEIELSRDLQRKLNAIAMSECPIDEMLKKFEDATKKFVAGLSDEDRAKAEKEMEKQKPDFKRLTLPWTLYFLKYDPAPTLKKVRCPVLALNGEFDLQVNPKTNLAAIGNALSSRKNPQDSLKEMPGLNHLFQHCTNGDPKKYGAIEETFAPEAMEAISRWILALP